MSYRISPLVAVGLAGLTFVTISGMKWLTVADEQEAPREDIVIEEVRFRHGDDLLSGFLYRPPGTTPHPAIVMILGSDRYDREYGGVGPALGRHFARAGFACFAWDKPGVGKSTGDYNNQTLRDRADEALAAVRFLRRRKDIWPHRIGLWGHSQGGMVAPLAASLSQDVAFLIEVSGWQGPAWKQDAVRVEAELREAGFRESDIERAVAFARMRMDMIRGTCPYKELEAAQNAVKTLPWFLLRLEHFPEDVQHGRGGSAVDPPESRDQPRPVHRSDLIERHLPALAFESARNAGRVVLNFRGHWRNDHGSDRVIDVIRRHHKAGTSLPNLAADGRIEVHHVNLEAVYRHSQSS
jgi:pimeloyl-ACP methyl ester carboxylesterase